MSIRSKVGLTLGPFLRCSVSVNTAVDNSDDTTLSNVCLGHTETAHEPTKVQQKLICPTCQTADRTAFKMARIDGGVFAIVDKDAIDALAVTSDMKDTAALTVHSTESVEGHILNGDRVYYLIPHKGEEAIYELFTSIVASTPELTYFTVWAARSKAAMYRLTTFNGTLAMQKIAWPTEIAPVPAFVTPGTVNEEHRKQAVQIARASVTAFDPSTYVDTRSDSLRELIRSSDTVNGVVVEADGKKTTVTGGGDMLSMLAASLAALQPAAPVKKARAPRTVKAKV